tara:strand:+ start:35 stop:211 length:177 start_codon:yes stop_codon:yes gene_type:complete
MNGEQPFDFAQDKRTVKIQATHPASKEAPLSRGELTSFGEVTQDRSQEGITTPCVPLY